MSHPPPSALTRRAALAGASRLAGAAAAWVAALRPAAAAPLPAARRPAPAASPPTVPRTGDMVGEPSVLVTTGDTILLDEAWARDLGILEVSAANPGVDPWVPGTDRLVTLPTAHLLPDAPRAGVVINKAELRLYHFLDGGRVETHAIGIGRDGHDTPEGQTTIVRKAREPTWYPTAATRKDRPELPALVGPGPDNPMGDRAMYFGWPTYAMHGTNKPYGVGRRVSRGCIRMYPETARHVFERVAVGTKVTVVSQPIKVGWHGGELFLEVHPDFDQLEDLEESYTFQPDPGPASMEEARRRIEAKAGPEHLPRVSWRAVEAQLVARTGLPAPVTGAVGREPGLAARGPAPEPGPSRPAAAPASPRPLPPSSLTTGRPAGREAMPGRPAGLY